MSHELKELESVINNANFWRDKIMYRTTLTGMNNNVTSQYAPYISKIKIVEDIKLKNVPYTDGRKLIPRDKCDRNTYFANLVNDALSDIWLGKKGFCFNTEQLKEILKICPKAKVRYDEYNGCWYCWLA